MKALAESKHSVPSLCGRNTANHHRGQTVRLTAIITNADAPGEANNYRFGAARFCRRKWVSFDPVVQRWLRILFTTKSRSASAGAPACLTPTVRVFTVSTPVDRVGHLFSPAAAVRERGVTTDRRGWYSSNAYVRACYRNGGRCRHCVDR